MQNTHLENLSSKIYETAQNISLQLQEKDHHPNIISLKELSYYCSEHLLDSKNEKEQFLCFYISKFIDAIFYNFCADTPYDEELQKVRLAFYTNLTKILKELAQSIKENNDDNLLTGLSALIGEFISKINLVNTNYPKPVKN